MKMLMISFAIIVIILSVWVIFHFPHIEDAINNYCEILDDVSNKVYLEEWDKVTDDLICFNLEWDKTNKLWTYFLNQKNIDNIDISIKILDMYVLNKNKTLTQAELERLKLLFKIIKKNECLALDNIF